MAAKRRKEASSTQALGKKCPCAKIFVDVSSLEKQKDLSSIHYICGPHPEKISTFTLKDLLPLYSVYLLAHCFEKKYRIPVSWAETMLSLLASTENKSKFSPCLLLYHISVVLEYMQNSGFPNLFQDLVVARITGIISFTLVRLFGTRPRS